MNISSYVTNSAEETRLLGESLGRTLRGGEVIELKSDLGGGKTTLTHGIAKGLRSVDSVSSPSFTICNTYRCSGDVTIHHFDFYRLNEPGIIAAELSEAMEDTDSVVIVEWGDIVAGMLPKDVVTITIRSASETGREITVEVPDERSYIAVGHTIQETP